MRAGNKDKRIEIQVLSTAKNTFGEDAETWTLFKTVWAEVRSGQRKAGTEIFEGGVVSQLMLTFRIDYIKSLSPLSHRIIYDNNIYDISSITERGRRAVSEITGKAQGL